MKIPVKQTFHILSIHQNLTVKIWVYKKKSFSGEAISNHELYEMCKRNESTSLHDHVWEHMWELWVLPITESISKMFCFLDNMRTDFHVRIMGTTNNRKHIKDVLFLTQHENWLSCIVLVFVVTASLLNMISVLFVLACTILVINFICFRKIMMSY